MTSPLPIFVGASSARAELWLPQPGHGVVLFADGLGDGEMRRRMREAARRLQQRGLGTVRFDTAGSEGAADTAVPADVDAMAQRLLLALETLPLSLGRTPIGLLGCGDGADAVLLAAARRPDRVSVAVCCSGRFVAADPVLADLRVPTMLIAGAADPERIDEARRVHALLRCEKRIDIVPRATRRFLEAGAVELATECAADWLCTHLAMPA